MPSRPPTAWKGHADMTDVIVKVLGGAVFAWIDGKRFDDIELVSYVDEVLDRFEQGDTGAWHKVFTPGRATYVIWQEGNVIFQTHDTPAKLTNGDSISWSWRLSDRL